MENRGLVEEEWNGGDWGSYLIFVAGDVTGKKTDTNGITLYLDYTVSRQVEHVVTARESFNLDYPYLVVNEAETLRITVDTLSIKLSNITIFYPHCVRVQFQATS
jgi:hypothetical protein